MPDSATNCNYIKSWTELAAVVDEHRLDKWIFRGVDDASYDLLPKIGRLGARKSINDGSDLPFDENLENAILKRYKRELSPHIQTPDRAHLSYDWDLRAVAQHHGLATRLLDWSGSPLIAAFFAVEPSGVKEGKRVDAALYGVPCPHEIDSNTSRWPQGHDVVAFYPPHLTPRITVQRGLFTIHRCPGVPWKPTSLKKWTIPSQACLELKLALNRAGINRSSLFPDPDGLAGHLNWLYKWGVE